MADVLPASREEMQAALLASPDVEAMVLAWSERAGDALAVVDEVTEAKNVVDAMTVMETVCRVRDVHTEAAIAASAMRVRAERRVGQLLRERDPAPSGRAALSPAAREGQTPPTLEEQGITYKESSQFQQLADLDDDEFEETLADVEDDVRDKGGGNVTRGAVLRRTDPEKQKRPDERWEDGDRFVERARALADAAEDAVLAIRWGHYPGDDLPLVPDAAIRAVTGARDACDDVLTEIRKRSEP